MQSEIKRFFCSKHIPFTELKTELCDHMTTVICALPVSTRHNGLSYTLNKAYFLFKRMRTNMEERFTLGNAYHIPVKNSTPAKITAKSIAKKTKPHAQGQYLPRQQLRPGNQ